MYPKYFGLSEPSFSITPDPQYLFLSAQHREALAHLLFGAGENGGFVLLTGEVGTGKTTICRAFLEQLPEGVEVALVLNPALTVVELMAAVCEEFGIVLAPRERSIKSMLDRLNRYLLDCHARGRRPVLMIDEAQNLHPAVLEQIRLLTNLETPKRKLLQIFLIGQPELRILLETEELRQLNQRITARCHLLPLTGPETAAYIRHRLAVAGVERPLFSRAAVRRVHRHSGGVPRLINLICDRALLGAAVSHRLQANTTIVDRAAREVRGKDVTQPWPRCHWLGSAAAASLAAILGLWIGVSGLLPWPWTHQLIDEPLIELVTESSLLDAAAPDLVRESETVADAELPEPQPLSLPAGDEMENAPGQDTSDAPDMAAERGHPRLVPLTPTDIAEAASAPLADLLGDRAFALERLLHAWGESQGDDQPPDCAALPAIGLACETGSGRWSELRAFDRPVAVQLRLAEGAEGQVVVLGLNEEYARIDAGEGRAAITLPIAELDQRWEGEYLLLWRLPPSGDRIIGRGATPAAIRWLRGQLRDWQAGDPSLLDSDEYDQTLLTQVRAFQSAHGLEVDGIAGPHTLMMLANVLADQARARAATASGAE